MSDFVRITDVSPRDGLQNERGVIPTAEKVRLVQLLEKTGVDEIEVTSFVSPKMIPQLADAAQLIELLGQNAPSQREGAGGRVAHEGRDEAGSTSSAPIGVGGRHDGRVMPGRSRLTSHRAKALRKATTGPERALWALLTDRALGGYRFRRQAPFGPYILDFFCPSELLVVEVDGRTHAAECAQVHDAERDRYLESFGLRVLRFSNDAVVTNTSGVARQILTALQSGRKPSPQPPPSGRGLSNAIRFSALVPNERGLQTLCDLHKRLNRPLISKISLFTAASESFTKKNINATIAESIERFRPVIARALDEGFYIRAYVSTVIACPIEGPISPDAVMRVVDQLIALDVDEIDFGDTIGAATPETTTRLLDAFRARFGDEWFHPERLTLHFHDTFGRAADCVRAALAAGVRSFDGSVAGLGGCPYAGTPEKPAPGNIATETLVRTIHETGYVTNVDLPALADAAAYAREIVARARAAAASASPSHHA